MSEERHNEMIQAMYGKVDIHEHLCSLKYLSHEEQDKLTQLLQSYPQMYKGTIGTLNTP